MTQAELGKAISPKVPVSQATIDKIESGATKKSKWLPQIAAVPICLASIDPAGAMLGSQQPPTPINDRPHGTDNNFPVYASAEGGPGEILVSTDPAGWIPTPPCGPCRGAYGLYIVGTSMGARSSRPATSPSWNPHLPVVAGGTYIFYAERGWASARHDVSVRKAHTDSWLVRQHNPPDGQKSDFSLSRKEWRICHRVFGKHSPV
ncbi:MAG: hypothetical protein IPK23_14950 [Rhizobiales bacterium]|nr:hypothetical protein [Hyphomicrobiales bacterium]